MKKLSFLIFLSLLLSGCATYRIQKGIGKDAGGYVVSRNYFTIAEYTVGKDNVVPAEKKIAEQRFQRRRVVVEDYYKKMGVIEPTFKQVFWDKGAMFVDFITGFFRLPFIAIADYKYQHDPEYRKKVKGRDDKEYADDLARKKSLREKLDTYIQKDLEAESPSFAKVIPQQAAEPAPQAEPVPQPEVKAAEPKLELAPKPAPEPAAVATAPKEEPKAVEVVEKASEPKLQLKEEFPIEQPGVWSKGQGAEAKEETAEIKKEPVEIKPQPAVNPPVAIITAKPVKGFSPLTVRFSGNKSHSRAGKIVSYLWDFGDGDTSAKRDSVNTFYSTSVDPKVYTVTLTVKDSLGNTSSSSAEIQVLNK